MLNEEHTRIKESGADQTADSLIAIEVIIDNSHSLAIATLPEIAERNQQQRTELQSYRNREGPVHRYIQIGCERQICFRRKPSDPNVTVFTCGGSIQPPHVPHLCCCCEALLNLNNTRRSNFSEQLSQKAVNQLASVEEDTLIKYREEGEINPRYLGQYVEIERKRLLQVQESQFLTYRSGPVRTRKASSSKAIFDNSYPYSDDEL
jgi:hypothetical protein